MCFTGRTPNSYNESFRTAPMTFFRKYAVSPPSVAIGQPLTDGIELLDRNARDAAYQGVYPDADIMTKESTVTGNRVIWINFAPMGSETHKPGALTFETSLTEVTDYVPIHFLPWQSQRVVHMQ